MGCNPTCFINCDKIVSDQCVQYTGPDIPAFGICSGDQLSVVEAAIVTNLQNAIVGIGITPELVTLENCPWLAAQFISKDPNLSNLLQLLIDSECSLKAMIDGINATLASQSMNFNLLCLQGVPANPTTNDIIQGVINTLCNINTIVAALPNTYVKISDLNNLVQQQITQFITNTETGSIQYATYLPIGVALPYFGSLANFDNTGKGIPSAGMTGIYLANGQNGTPDMRGRNFIGAVRNVPGGTLDAAVDPSGSLNTAGNVNYSLNDKFGENFHTNTILETPSHSHNVNDPQHRHTVTRGDAYNGNGDQAAGYVGGGLSSHVQTSAQTSLSSTGITLSSTGGGQPHNNVQPGIAGYWIIRMV